MRVRQGRRGSRVRYLQQVIERVVAALLHDAVELVRVDLAITITVGLVNHVLHTPTNKMGPGNERLA